MFMFKYIIELQREETSALTCESNEESISLHIHTVWSDYSVSTWGDFPSFAVENAPSKTSDQTARIRMVI